MVQLNSVSINLCIGWKMACLLCKCM